ncbi:MAG: acetate--CoA ligase [Euryarchaeota archaeon]|jgi:acetyl-CoA synthetase|nr:acetate--CoA ligase [Euryarchaeota archaeon]
MSQEEDTSGRIRGILWPDPQIVKDSNIQVWMNRHQIQSYDQLLEKAVVDPEWFWDEMARELNWQKPYHQVLKWEAPHSQWFQDGNFNIVDNAVDRHAQGPHMDKLAFIWQGEDGEVRKMSYHQLYQEVNRFANALQSLGVGKGDTVTIYLPMILELPVAMLACAKIGAVHSVVFSGFWAKRFRERVDEAQSKVAITSDGFSRRGKVLALKANVDRVLLDAPTVEKVIVVRHAKIPVDMTAGRDLWWHELVEGMSEECPTAVLEAEDPLFILYTSGTTGVPKGVLHVHAGYAVGVYTTLKMVFDLKEDDVWWCAADIGWITGHSYIVYAPLLLGVTSVLFEGTPDYPDPGCFWRIVEKYGVNVFYTAPTTIRLFMKYGEKWPQKYDLSSLRLLGSVGEPINPKAWLWYHEHIGGGRCPIMDTWWQTETGMHLITPLPISPLKPGSAFKPFPTIIADVVDDEGNSVVGEGGHLVIKSPWPAMFRTLYRNPLRFREAYWNTFPGIYLSGDVARVDEDGYFWVQGREDDVLNVSGHRISTAEVESALVSHPVVAEAAVVGKPHPLKGEEISAFVILKKDAKEPDNLEIVLKNQVRTEIGPIATPAQVRSVEDLPKTRSGKIMRRVIKALVKGEDPGDTSTLANPEAVENLEEVLKG